MTASNRYKLNGNDLYDVYGFVVSSGSDDFLKFPDRKESLTYNWPDENGTQRDLSDPKFEEGAATLKGVIIAVNAADFWDKYNALWYAFSLPETRALEVVELSKTFDIFYKKATKPTRFTRLKEVNKIAVEVEFELGVVGYNISFTPLPGIGQVTVVNQNGDLIETITPPGEVVVLQISGIKDDGSGVYTNTIIDLLS